MKKIRKPIKSFLYIITGLFSFLGFNIYYALSSFESFNTILKDMLLVVSAILLALFAAFVFLSSREYTTKISKLRYILISTFTFIIGGWIILTASVYLFRYDVLYTNSPVSQQSLDSMLDLNNFEKIHIVTPSSIVLEGYLAANHENEKAPLAIYFGGRGEEASNISEYSQKIKGCSLAFINYRGCGLNEGTQDEENFFSDADLIYDYFAARKDIDKDNMVLIAHSLGTGVAIHLASERDIKGVVLSAPYDIYTTGVVQDKLPLVPTQLLFSDRLDSLSIASRINIPALFLFAENDNTVYRERSLRLYNSWGGDAEKIIIKGTHHENITLNDITWNNINEFLGKIFD